MLTHTTVADRVDELAWDDLRAQLDDRGFALTEPAPATGTRSTRTPSGFHDAR